jgi:hypothetical protein
MASMETVQDNTSAGEYVGRHRLDGERLITTCGELVGHEDGLCAEVCYGDGPAIFRPVFGAEWTARHYAPEATS